MDTSCGDVRQQLNDQEIADRLAVLATKVKQLQAEVAWARKLRWGLAIALAAIVLLGTAAFTRLGRQIQSPDYVNRILQVAGQRWDARSREYSHELQRIAQRTAPVYRDALLRQAKRDMPQFVAAASHEQQRFVDELADDLERRVRQRYRNAANKLEQVVVDELPGIDNSVRQEAILANLLAASDNLVQQYYAEQLERNLRELQTHWEEFPRADPPRADELSTSDQLLGQLAELVSFRLSKTDLEPVVTR